MAAPLFKKRLLWASILILALLVLLAIALFGKKAYTQYYKTIYPKGYADEVERVCAEYEVDPYLVYAMIKQESDFSPDAVSIDNARGLMQLTEPTFDWVKTKLDDGQEVTFEDMFDPATNIRYGVYLVHYLCTQFSDTDAVIAAYHAGINITKQWLADSDYSKDGKTLSVIPYADTKYHVGTVQKIYQKYIALWAKPKK